MNKPSGDFFAPMQRMSEFFKSVVATEDDFAEIKAKYAEDLPDLSDQDLLVEMYIVMNGCEPCGRVPSSARMRRILRTAIELMEQKIAATNA